MTKEQAIAKARELGFEISTTPCNNDLVRFRIIETQEYMVLSFAEAEPKMFDGFVNPDSKLYELFK